MHPAYSIIFFSTLSGAGYGLLSMLALFALLGWTPPHVGIGIVGIGGALAQITIGLLSSTAHLGRPERAWRAFSQWRSSWLSREGVLAVATFGPAGMFAIGWILFSSVSGIFAISAAATIVLSMITVWCTGMIYASLPTIRAWYQPLVSPVYVAIALATGAVLLHVLLLVFGEPSKAAAVTALAALVIAAALKLSYWSTIDKAERTYSVEAATGLGRFGKVRPLEPAHTQPNYVMREMGYRIGRKHAVKLRRIAITLLVAVPSVCLVLALLLGGASAQLLGALAAVSAAIGVFTERWLFFAEAEHVVMLYYGADAT